MALSRVVVTRHVVAQCLSAYGRNGTFNYNMLRTMEQHVRWTSRALRAPYTVSRDREQLQLVARPHIRRWWQVLSFQLIY